MLIIKSITVVIDKDNKLNLTSLSNKKYVISQIIPSKVLVCLLTSEPSKEYGWNI